MPEKITLPNDILLSKAIQTVARGNIAIIPVKGQSMYPFIHGNKDCVELYPPIDLKVGDIVLAQINSAQYLLHRIYKFNGKEGIILMGDGNIHNTEHCNRQDIKAKALIKITSKGRKKRLDSLLMTLAAQTWKYCLPIRGILLKVLRRI